MTLPKSLQSIHIGWQASQFDTFARPDQRTLECFTCGRLDFSMASHLLHVEEHGDDLVMLGTWDTAA